LPLAGQMFLLQGVKLKEEVLFLNYLGHLKGYS